MRARGRPGGKGQKVGWLESWDSRRTSEACHAGCRTMNNAARLDFAVPPRRPASGPCWRGGRQKARGRSFAIRASMRRADRPRVPVLCRDSHPASLISLDAVYGLSPPPVQGTRLGGVDTPDAAPAMSYAPHLPEARTLTPPEAPRRGLPESVPRPRRDPQRLDGSAAPLLADRGWHGLSRGSVPGSSRRRPDARCWRWPGGVSGPDRCLYPPKSTAWTGSRRSCVTSGGSLDLLRPRRAGGRRCSWRRTTSRGTSRR